MSIPPENTPQITSAKISRGPLGKIEPILSTFSQTVPPSDFGTSNVDKEVYMVTVGISHYCEKARWSLDLLRSDPSNNLDYYESAHVPGLAALYTTKLDEAVSATPIIRVREGGEEKIIRDSTKVLDYLTPPSFMGDSTPEYEDWLDYKLGSGVRCFCYYHILGKGNDALLTGLATDQTSAIEGLVFGQMAKRGLIQPGMKKFMGITEEGMKESKKAITEVFEEVGGRLEKGGGVI